MWALGEIDEVVIRPWPVRGGRGWRHSIRVHASQPASAGGSHRRVPRASTLKGLRRSRTSRSQKPSCNMPRASSYLEHLVTVPTLNVRGTATLWKQLLSKGARKITSGFPFHLSSLPCDQKTPLHRNHIRKHQGSERPFCEDLTGRCITIKTRNTWGPTEPIKPVGWKVGLSALMLKLWETTHEVQILTLMDMQT